MGSIIWIPTILGMMSAYLYFLSVNIPTLTSLAAENITVEPLKFPTSLDDISSIAKLLSAYKEEHLAYVVILFCSAYIYKQTFAIPGSVFMNLLGGALFGVSTAFPLVCFLTATGATCCYFLSYFFGKHYILKYFPEKVKIMQQKVEENYESLFFFLLFLRFFPMSPNWFLNMALPILNVPPHVFFLSALVGLMPYNYICVQTGGMLAEIKSVNDIFTVWTMVKLAGIALTALVPGMLVKRLKDNKLKSM